MKPCRELFEPIFLFRTEEILLAGLVDERGLLVELLAEPGSREQVAVQTSNVLRRAVTIKAAGVVLAHNHPSGDARPSASDKSWTRMFALQCEALAIELVDHLLFGVEEPFSMRRAGLL
jgi:DNA repair protein RadC